MRPLLAVDIDGVISLFGFEERPPQTSFQLVDGVPHCISLPTGDRLLRLSENFELVWASGWEDKANFYLPELLGLPELPHIGFDVSPRSCYEWAERRPAPTLLVPTEPALGLEEGHVAALEMWAASLI
jgi:hypothetical protein